jgi:DNA-directed RNA polymerase specialized sigma24 family protein
MPLDAAMAGVLALLVDAREARVRGDKDATKVELLLSNVGLAVEDIAAATGKKPDAVRKAIQRGRAR